MIEESPSVTYGRLLEGLHLADYTTSRVIESMFLLLENYRWRQIGQFKTQEEFLSTLKLDDIRWTHKDNRELRKEVALRLTSEFELSQRAVARLMGVSNQTVSRVTNVTETPEIPPLPDTNVTTPPPPIDIAAREEAERLRYELTEIRTTLNEAIEAAKRQAEDEAAKLVDELVSDAAKDQTKLIANLQQKLAIAEKQRLDMAQRQKDEIAKAVTASTEVLKNTKRSYEETLAAEQAEIFRLEKQLNEAQEPMLAFRLFEESLFQAKNLRTMVDSVQRKLNNIACAPLDDINELAAELAATAEPLNTCIQKIRILQGKPSPEFKVVNLKEYRDGK